MAGSRERACADERLVVPAAAINGTALRLIFDTGTGADLMIWRSAAERLHLPVSWPPPGAVPEPGKVLFGLSDSCTVTLMGVVFGQRRVAVFDAPPGMPEDTSFDGTVGWGIGRQNILVLFLAENRIEFAAQVPPECASWIKLGVRQDLTTLVLEAPDRRHPLRTLFIDTGNPGGISLPHRAWTAWRQGHPDSPATVDAYYTPGAGLIVGAEAWADRLPVGGFELTGVPISQANVADRANGGGMDFAGTVGLAALRRMDLVIDGRAGVAYLRPRRDAPAPYPHNRLGAVFVPVSLASDPLMAHVVAGGPAYAAGIRDGDVLLCIGGRSVTAWRAEPALRVLAHETWQQAAGTVVALTLERGGVRFTTKAVLRDMIGPGAGRQRTEASGAAR